MWKSRERLLLLSGCNDFSEEICGDFKDIDAVVWTPPLLMTIFKALLKYLMLDQGRYDSLSMILLILLIFLMSTRNQQSSIG